MCPGQHIRTRWCYYKFFEPLFLVGVRTQCWATSGRSSCAPIPRSATSLTDTFSRCRGAGVQGCRGGKHVFTNKKSLVLILTGQHPELQIHVTDSLCGSGSEFSWSWIWLRILNFLFLS